MIMAALFSFDRNWSYHTCGSYSHATAFTHTHTHIRTCRSLTHHHPPLYSTRSPRLQSRDNRVKMPPKMDPNEVSYVVLRAVGGEVAATSALAPKIGPLGLVSAYSTAPPPHLTANPCALSSHSHSKSTSRVWFASARCLSSRSFLLVPLRSLVSMIRIAHHLRVIVCGPERVIAVLM